MDLGLRLVRRETIGYNNRKAWDRLAMTPSCTSLKGCGEID